MDDVDRSGLGGIDGRVAAYASCVIEAQLVSLGFATALGPYSRGCEIQPGLAYPNGIPRAAA